MSTLGTPFVTNLNFDCRPNSNLKDAVRSPRGASTVLLGTTGSRARVVNQR